MPLPLKIIMTPVLLPCTRCEVSGPGLDISFFAGELMARSGPLCLVCLSRGEELVGEVLLTELAPPSTRRKALRRQKKASTRQEIEVAEALGALVQRASGALAGAKGDGRKKGVLRFEAKYTMDDSYRLKLDDLYKIAGECHGKERPLLVLDFKDRATGRLRDRFAVLHFDHAKEMFDAGHNR